MKECSKQILPEAKYKALSIVRGDWIRASCVQVREIFQDSPRINEPEALRKSLVQLIAMRVIILSALLGMSIREALSTGMSQQQAHLMLWLLVGSFAVSLISIVVLRFVKTPFMFGYVQLAVDVVLATLAIYVTGSPVSISLYLLVILGAAVIFGRKGAVISAALSGICYGILTSGILSPVSQGGRFSNTLDILAVYISLVVIASVSGYLAKRLETLANLADLNASNLTKLSRQQEQLFDDISEGIITLDLDEAITGINQAARSIMGLSRIDSSAFIGKPLPSVLKSYGIAEADDFAKSLREDERSSELKVKGAHESHLHLHCSVRPLTDPEGNITGKMLLFSDISHIKSIEERLSLHEEMTKLMADTVDPHRSEATARQDIHIVGESTIMQSVFSLVERVAPSNVSVLINGESGTGKELIAQAIHASGPRKDEPFVAINCGAIPENLMESELFGHKKGAFTGAVHDSLGLFRQANKGTVFLDEVGELPIHLQTKLLRVLQQKTIRPVGDVKDIPVDVRVMAATNRNLRNEIANNRFREDLFYRLNVVNILVPPLREHREDIPLLVRHFISRISGPDDVLGQISPEALQLLMSYNFPGNIRELENLIERALVLGGHAILPEHLPDEVRRFKQNGNGEKSPMGDFSQETEVLVLPVNLEQRLESLEKDYLEEALRRTEGVKKQAAELLGLNFRSFRYRLKKYGLSDPNTTEQTNIDRE